jgi:NAD(P)-dependent dehydrogenase (short-subunit alcohol dehydrogenase family)
VNNAGGLVPSLERTADGLDYTFALNHLAYFLLTRELRGLLAATPGARVVSTSSAAHRAGKLDLDDFARRPSGRTGFPSYCDSKLANILFTRELARRLEGSGVVANCYHPGFVKSGFGLNNGTFAQVAIKVAGTLFARNVDKGAETMVWLAASPEAASLQGQYLHDKKPAAMSRLAQDDALAARLWALSEKLVESL